MAKKIKPQFVPRNSKLTANPIFSARLPRFFEVLGTPNPKAPLPSVLLAKALKLFNNGKNWTKGHLHTQTRETWNPKRNRFIDYDEITELRKAEKPLPPPVVAYCAIGGIQKINTSNEDLAKAFLCYAVDEAQTTDAINEHSTPNEKSIIFVWNDDSDRTWPEVRAAFKSAIALAKSLGC